MCSKAGACEEVIKIESNVKTMSSQVAEMHDAMFVSKGDDRAIVELVRDNKKNLERHINDTQQIHLPPKHPEPRKTQEVDISASFKDGFKANFKNINPKDLGQMGRNRPVKFTCI